MLRNIYYHILTLLNSDFFHHLLVLQYFINRGSGNTELPGYVRCASTFPVKCQHAVSVDGAPATKPDAGKLRALGVTTPERVGSNPDIPTISEAGVKGYEFFAWDGPYAPKGTPTAVLDKLNAAVNQALQRKSLESRGAVPSPTTRQSLADFGAKEYTRLGKVVKTAGAAID